MYKWNLQGSWLGASQGLGASKGRGASQGRGHHRGGRIARDGGIAGGGGITWEGGSQGRGHPRGRGASQRRGTSQGHIAREAKNVEIFFSSLFPWAFLISKHQRLTRGFPILREISRPSSGNSMKKRKDVTVQIVWTS